MPSPKSQVPLNPTRSPRHMPQAVQNNDGKNNLAFSNVQAYTLAVITLAIGIAVGYFARGSAPVSTAGENTQAASAPTGMGNAPMGSAQLPGIGSGDRKSTRLNSSHLGISYA